MTHQFKAVFFDLDGTLRIPFPGPTDAFIHFARSLDIDISPAAERRVKIWAHAYWGQEERVKRDMARFDSDAFWVNYSRLLLETVEASHDLENRARLVREWFESDYQPQVDLAPHSKELLSQLKQQGYIVGLISNRAQPLADDVAELGLAGCFDILLAAGEVGYWKPNPLIFAHVLAEFEGLQPEECIYVGDNYYADGRGAEAAGWVPILYDPDNLYETTGYRRIRQMGELQEMLLPANGRDLNNCL